MLAIVAGGAMGVALRHGDFCFHSTWRQAFRRPPRTSLLRAYATLLLVSTPIVQLMRATGIIDPFIPGFAPGAAIIGGLLFGIGMVIAQTCVSGMFYKLGAGMAGMLVAIGAWAVGDIIAWQGPLQGIRERLNDGATSTTASSAPGIVAVVVFAAALAWCVFVIGRADDGDAPAVQSGRSAPWRGTRLGVVTALVIVVAWLLSDWHGVDYPFGTSSVASNVWDAVTDGAGISWWIPLALISIVPGALIAALTTKSFWFRGETATRYAQLAGGGFVMGVGAAIAGGCNLGHSMVGVPLLSVASIVTTAAIAAGIFVGAQVADSSRLARSSRGPGGPRLATDVEPRP